MGASHGSQLAPRLPDPRLADKNSALGAKTPHLPCHTPDSIYGSIGF